DLPPDRRAMPAQRPGDLTVILARRDPPADPLTLLKTQPPRRPGPATPHRRHRRDPLHRALRTPHLGGQHAHALTSAQPLHDRLPRIRTHPPIHPAHNTPDHSTKRSCCIDQMKPPTYTGEDPTR